MVRWHRFAPQVNCCQPKDLDQPFDKMLHHALKQLIKNIGGDRNEYVNKGKACPKWFKNWLETSLMACQVEHVVILIIC